MKNRHPQVAAAGSAPGQEPQPRCPRVPRVDDRRPGDDVMQRRRRSPSRMPANPNPRNRKLNGSASVRASARRPLASVLSSVTTRTPNSAMAAVVPLAAQQQAQWTNPRLHGR